MRFSHYRILCGYNDTQNVDVRNWMSINTDSLMAWRCLITPNEFDYAQPLLLPTQISISRAIRLKIMLQDHSTINRSERNIRNPHTPPIWGVAVLGGLEQ